MGTVLLISIVVRIVDFPGGVVVKNLPANAGNLRDMDSILGSGILLEKGMASQSLPGESHGQRSLAATVHRVAESGRTKTMHTTQ